MVGISILQLPFQSIAAIGVETVAVPVPKHSSSWEIDWRTCPKVNSIGWLNYILFSGWNYHTLPFSAASATSFMVIFLSLTLNFLSFMPFASSITDLLTAPGRINPSKGGVTSSSSETNETLLCIWVHAFFFWNRNAFKKNRLMDYIKLCI